LMVRFASHSIVRSGRLAAGEGPEMRESTSGIREDSHSCSQQEEGCGLDWGSVGTGAFHREERPSCLGTR
jgi:hypothetical protein